VNGVMYVLSTGCQWRYIPKDLPPRSTVHDYLTRWNYDYSATVRMAGQRQQACPVAACEEDGVTDAARQVWCCTARHVDDAVMTSLCLMSRLLSLVARRFCRAAAER
jgi:Putative transposase of IS4/5 family (DUF4096)